jgi:hypothetical protein
MDTIKLKVNGWDGQSLIVTAICGDSEKGFECYTPHAYQPAYFDSTDVDGIVRQIAKSSVSIIESNQKIENFAKNENLVNEFSTIVGNEYEWNIQDLFADEFGGQPSPTSDIYHTLNVEEKLRLAGIEIEDLKVALGITTSI